MEAGVQAAAAGTGAGTPSPPSPSTASCGPHRDGWGMMPSAVLSQAAQAA
jgi:hypothetical protein